MTDDRYEHIHKIRSEFRASQRVKDSLNNSIKALAKDLYSKDTHFIFELIQNAEDNAYRAVEPSLSFRLVKKDPTAINGNNGALIVQNNEIGFSPDNVNAICAVGQTTKRKIQGYIGEKGIGFKSVFRITSSPLIFSNGYRFSLPEHDEETGLGYIVPKWIIKQPEGIDPSQTTIILPLDKAAFTYEKIEEMLCDIEPETIIFLSKLKEIRIQTDTGNDVSILKDGQNSHQVQILVEGIMQGKSFSKVDDFLLFRKTYEKPSNVFHEKRSGIDKRDISIAFPLNENRKGMGKLFAYLPVRSDTGLPFIINADFILPSSREEILDNFWNRWLMRCVGDLAACSLPLLRDRGILSIILLESIAKRILEITEEEMFHPIVLSINQAFKDKDLLPADDESFVKAQNAKIGRGIELKNLLNQDQLGLLFQSPHTVKWLSADITQDLTPNLRRYLITQLGIEEVRPEKFVELLTHEFLKNQSDSWIIDFYSFFDKDRTESWKKPDAVLRKKKIIRLEDNLHVLPFKSDGTPNAYLPSSTTTNFPTVKRTIFRDENAASFLKKIGIIEPDAFAEIIDSILSKYVKEPILVSVEENIDDLKKIASAILEKFKDSPSSLLAKARILSEQVPWLEDTIERLKRFSIEDHGEFSSEENEDFIQSLITIALKKVLATIRLLRASNGKKTEFKSPQEVYKKTVELRYYFQDNLEAWFICDDYPDEILSLFDNLEVNKQPKIKKRSPNDDGFVIVAASHSHHRRGLNGFDPGIEVHGLDFAIANPTLEKSIFIWNSIALPHSACIRGEVEQASKKTYENGKIEECVSKFGRLLTENAWLPGPNGGFSKPKELFLNELPKEFQKHTPQAEALSVAIGMKKPEQEQALQIVTGGDPDLKLIIERFKAASEADRRKMLNIIPHEIPPDPVPSFKDGLRSLGRSQQNIVGPTDKERSAVSNPDRYQEKLNEQVEEGVKEHSSSIPKIRFSIVRNVASNAEARRFLYEQYHGRCQIAGTTFPKAHGSRNGLSENYFEACSLLSYANADYLNDPGNMLCVSADTMAKLKFANFHFIDSLEGAIEKFRADGEMAESVSVRIRLAGEECTINWSQRHFMRLIALYDKA